VRLQLQLQEQRKRERALTDRWVLINNLKWVWQEQVLDGIRMAFMLHLPNNAVIIASN